MTNERASLASLQQWLQSVITAPEGVSKGIDAPATRQIIDVSSGQVEQVIRPSSQLDALGRLNVYGHAYFARLMECLEGDFPAVRHLLGEETFRSFAISYLREHPPRSYTLADLGAGFAAFLQSTRPAELAEGGWADFLIDLVRLEWTYAQVFNGPGIERTRTLQPEDLREVDPELWPACRLKPIPCLRLESYSFPVHEYASAVRRQEAPDRFPAAEPTRLVITRRDYVVRRSCVPEEEFAVLGWLCADLTIEETIRTAIETFSERIEPRIPGWFREWSQAGYFFAVQRP
jgi:hypothetical protein